MPADRTAAVTRTTGETDLTVTLNLDSPAYDAPATGHPFFDHMLDALARHSRLGLSVRGTGDLHVEPHHLIEDTGITLGQALSQALGDRRGTERYGSAFVPMDETLAHVVLDFSGRPWITFDPSGFEGDANGFNVHHLRELLRGFCNHAGVTMHVRVLSGTETHHVCEAVVKAWALSLRKAVAVVSDTLPSTKGML